LATFRYWNFQSVRVPLLNTLIRCSVKC
jgi:hypothetical protein